MSFDPYVVLGLHSLRRQASADDILRAFRRRSKETHPDLNPGNKDAAAEFDRVRRAHDILKDPEARGRYDATGEVPEESAATGDEGALAIISQLLAGFLGVDEDPFTQDLAAIMRSALDKKIRESEAMIGKLMRAEERAAKMAGRFKRKPEAVMSGENVLESMLAYHKAEIAKSIASTERDIAKRKRARALLEGYSFKADEVQRYDPWSLNSASRFATPDRGWSPFDR